MLAGLRAAREQFERAFAKHDDRVELDGKVGPINTDAIGEGSNAVRRVRRCRRLPGRCQAGRDDEECQHGAPIICSVGLTMHGTVPHSCDRRVERSKQSNGIVYCLFRVGVGANEIIPYRFLTKGMGRLYIGLSGRPDF